MKNEETHKHLRNILLKGTEHKAPAGMSEQVLKAWKARETIASMQHPLLPTWLWWGILCLIAALVFWALSNNQQGSSSAIGEYLSRITFSFKIPLPAPSPVLFMALAAICAMLLVNIAILRKKEAEQG